MPQMFFSPPANTPAGQHFQFSGMPQSPLLHNEVAGSSPPVYAASSAITYPNSMASSSLPFYYVPNNYILTAAPQHNYPNSSPSSTSHAFYPVVVTTKSHPVTTASVSVTAVSQLAVEKAESANQVVSSLTDHLSEVGATICSPPPH